MGRDWTPFEHYLSEQKQIQMGYGDLFDFLENLKIVYDDKEEMCCSPEEIAVRRQFPQLGRLLMDSEFMLLYDKLSKINGGIDLLHAKDKTLAEFIETRVGDENSSLIKWFFGKLDQNFYYSERNNELFCESIIKEAILLASKDKYTVAPLTEIFSEEVEHLDEMSGNCVAEMVDEDNRDFAWGLFKDGELAGYCTIGGADEIEFDYPGYSSSSLLLSDVFVVPEHRGQGAATFLVNEAIRKRTEDDKQLVFLTVLDDNLSRLYEKCGFEYIENGVMVRDERVKSVDEKIVNATQVCETLNNRENSKDEVEFEKE